MKEPSPTAHHLLHDAGGDVRRRYRAARILDGWPSMGLRGADERAAWHPHENHAARATRCAEGGARWRHGFPRVALLVETMWTFMLIATALVVARSLLLPGWRGGRSARLATDRR